MRRLAVVALVPLFLLACGGSDSTGPESITVAGTWNLQTVNGSPLPYVVLQIGADKIELLSDRITAVESGSFTQLTQFRVTESGVVTNESLSDAGSFTRNGNAVTVFFNSDGSTATGSISGNTFTVGVDGTAYVYKRN